MAEPFASISLSGIGKLERTMGRIEALSDDMTPFFREVGDAVRTVVIGRFEGERGPGGVPWPKSKRALGTAPNSRGRKVPGRTLFDTGELQNSLADEVTPHGVTVGFRGLHNPAKAPANQFGSNKQSVVAPHTRTITHAFGVPLPAPKSVNVRSYGRINNLPPRPMLGADTEMTNAVVEVGRLHLLNLLVQR